MSNYALRVPDFLMKTARSIAKKERTSVNQLFVTAIAEKLSALQTADLLQEKAALALEEDYFNVLAQVSSQEPLAQDKKDV
ncbi:MAG: toxin-antitoxin system HicB family antitoxin [Proteobacteria bacterium]|nr:toxin-antitoxin system HicB family antitoxin [Pseudomonadota bacterium]